MIKLLNNDGGSEINSDEHAICYAPFKVQKTYIEEKYKTFGLKDVIKTAVEDCIALNQKELNQYVK